MRNFAGIFTLVLAALDSSGQSQGRPQLVATSANTAQPRNEELSVAYSTVTAQQVRGEHSAPAQAQVSEAASNPRSKNFDAPADGLFKAALRAAAGHRIIKTEDEGLKQMDEKGQEIISFAFFTRIKGYTHSVLADVEVAQIGSDSAKLTIFYCKQGGTNTWVPSASLQLREAQLEAKFQKILDALESQRSLLELRYEAGGISRQEKFQSEIKIEDEEHEARLDKIKQVHDARVADLAQMPTSTFPAMVEASDAFFNLVERNLRALTPSK